MPMLSRFISVPVGFLHDADRKGAKICRYWMLARVIFHFLNIPLSISLVSDFTPTNQEIHKLKILQPSSFILHTHFYHHPTVFPVSH